MPKFEEYLRTGVPGFDELLGNRGIPKGAVVALLGGPGCGKTLLALQICKNLSEQGKKCLYWSLNEDEERIKWYMETRGWRINENLIVKRGDTYGIAKEVESVFLNKRGMVPYKALEESFFRKLKEISPEFFVLDSLTAVSSIFINERHMYRIYLEELFRTLNENGITSFLICEETKGVEGCASGVEEFLADGVVILYNVRKGSVRARGIEVFKFRGLKHERKIVGMEITEDGIVVYPEQELLEI